MHGSRHVRIWIHRHRTTAVVAASVIVLGVALGAAVAPFVASGLDGATSSAERADETAAANASLETFERQAASPSAHASSAAGATDYEVVPSDASGNPGDRVTVDVEARTLIDDHEDADVTGYELHAEYDDERLAFTGAETFLDDDEELEVDASDGTVTVDWTSSAFEIIGGELVDVITGGDSTPNMNVTVVTLEFAVVGDPGETAAIDLHDESRMWGGATDLSEYDEDEIRWGESTVEIEGEPDEGEDEVPEESRQVGEVEAVSQGGFVAFDESSRSDAESEGVSFPVADDGDDPIEIEGVVFGDGTWESTRVSFPTLDAGPVDAEVEARDGLHGEIDEETGAMTVDGELTVLVDGDEDRQFSFDLGGTTGDSGALSGSGDFESSPAAATLVDNEFLVEDRTGDSVVDSALGLPSTNEGNNWFAIDLDVELEEREVVTGTVDGVVTDGDGEPIDGATIEVIDGVGSTETDADGTYSLALESGTHELRVDAEGYVEETVDVDVTEAETTTRDVALEAGDAEFAVSIDADDAASGETLTVTGTVENVGSVTGSQDVTVSVGDESTTETVELEAGETETVTLEWDVGDGDAGAYTATIESDDDSASTDVGVSESTGTDDGIEADEDDDTFVAHSQGGFISFAEDTNREDARAEGLEFPVQGEDDEHVRIVGVIHDDGTWESTSIVFPNLVTDSGIEAEVEAPDGLEGEIDEERGEMTARGELRVAIEGDPDRQFSFEIDTTSGESGALTGTADFDDDTASVTLVDNEFLVEDTTGDGIIDSELDLPADDAGSNWIELEFDVELDVDDEAIEEASTSGDGSDEDDEDESEESSTGSSMAIVTGIGKLVGVLGALSAAGALGVGLFNRFGS